MERVTVEVACTMMSSGAAEVESATGPFQFVTPKADEARTAGRIAVARIARRNGREVLAGAGSIFMGFWDFGF